MAADTNSDTPTLKQKLISSANWGMLAGFWVELPILVTSAFRQVNVSKWTARAVLPATLLGVAYGFTKPAREQRQAERELEQGGAVERPSVPFSDAAEPAGKSWTAAETARDNNQAIARD